MVTPFFQVEDMMDGGCLMLFNMYFRERANDVSGCKWLQVAAKQKINMRTSYELNVLCVKACKYNKT